MCDQAGCQKLGSAVNQELVLWNLKGLQEGEVLKIKPRFCEEGGHATQSFLCLMARQTPRKDITAFITGGVVGIVEMDRHTSRFKE